MRHGIEVHHDRVFVPARSYSYRGEEGPVDIPLEVLDTLATYSQQDIADARGALTTIKHHPHYWITGQELVKKVSAKEPVSIVWYEADYDYSHWESMTVHSVKVDADGSIWAYDDPEAVKAYYLEEDNGYSDSYQDYTDEDWLEYARNDTSFYDTQRLLVIEKHPTLF